MALKCIAFIVDEPFTLTISTDRALGWYSLGVDLVQRGPSMAELPDAGTHEVPLQRGVYGIVYPDGAEVSWVDDGALRTTTKGDDGPWPQPPSQPPGSHQGSDQATWNSLTWSKFASGALPLHVPGQPDKFLRLTTL